MAADIEAGELLSCWRLRRNEKRLPKGAILIPVLYAWFCFGQQHVRACAYPLSRAAARRGAYITEASEWHSEFSRAMAEIS
jgi:hypothetical protein